MCEYCMMCAAFGSATHNFMGGLLYNPTWHFDMAQIFKLTYSCSHFIERVGFSVLNLFCACTLSHLDTTNRTDIFLMVLPTDALVVIVSDWCGMAEIHDELGLLCTWSVPRIWWHKVLKWLRRRWYCGFSVFHCRCVEMSWVVANIHITSCDTSTLIVQSSVSQ